MLIIRLRLMEQVMLSPDQLSTRQAALKEKLSAPERRGRPAARQEWNDNSPIEQVNKRIAALRRLIAKTRNVTLIEGYQKELKTLLAIRRHQKAVARHVRRMRVHRATKKARQVKAEGRRLEKELHEAANQEQKKQELLARWQTSLPGGEGSTADRLSMMRPGAIYRWRESVQAFSKVESYVLDLCGPQSGDVRRQSHQMTGEMFDGASWVACEDATLRRVMKERAMIVQDVKPQATEQKPSQTFDSRGMPVICDIYLHGPLALSWQEILNWKRENWKGFAEWEAAQELATSAAPQVVPEPISSPLEAINPYNGMSSYQLTELRDKLTKELTDIV